MPLLSLFGLTVASDFPFAGPMTPGAGAADLSLRRRRVAELGPPPGALRWQSGAGAGELRLFAGAAGGGVEDVLRIGAEVEYRLSPDAVEVRQRAAWGPPEHADRLIQIHLLGIVLALWLERRGVTCVHASAVVVDGRAVAFLAGNRGGKTSLAVALMAAGAELLADDLLAVEPPGAAGAVARPAYPQMRLWPEDARTVAPALAGLEPVHPELAKLRVPVGGGGLGVFCRHPRPLARLYLLERSSGRGDDRLIPVSPRDAVAELLRHSFIPRLAAGAGLAVARFERLAALAETVPMRCLDLSAGADWAVRVAEDARRFKPWPYSDIDL